MVAPTQLQLSQPDNVDSLMADLTQEGNGYPSPFETGADVAAGDRVPEAPELTPRDEGSIIDVLNSPDVNLTPTDATAVPLRAHDPSGSS